MNCPYCNFRFKVLAANAAIIPDIAPLLCEDCGAVSLLDNGEPRRITAKELGAIKQSPAWRDVIEPAHQLIFAKNRGATMTLTDGSPAVTPDHREIDPATGMQKAYVVLSAEERAKGFVRPIRRSYIHEKCGSMTTMGQSLAETYARDPKFYTGTFCVSCKAHFPVGENGEFVWEDGTKVGSYTLRMLI